MRIDVVDGSASADLVGELADILLDCVAGGASVGFLDNLSTADACSFWQSALRRDGAVTFVAHDDTGTAVGVVQLVLVGSPNGTHRADVAKLLVHRRARGTGVAAALMAALEAEAMRRGRWLLVLDTATGSAAEAIYAGWGWVRSGTIPDFALNPDATLTATTVMYRDLR